MTRGAVATIRIYRTRNAFADQLLSDSDRVGTSWSCACCARLPFCWRKVIVVVVVAELLLSSSTSANRMDKRGTRTYVDIKPVWPNWSESINICLMQIYWEYSFENIMKAFELDFISWKWVSCGELWVGLTVRNTWRINQAMRVIILAVRVLEKRLVIECVMIGWFIRCCVAIGNRID